MMTQGKHHHAHRGAGVVGPHGAVIAAGRPHAVVALLGENMLERAFCMHFVHVLCNINDIECVRSC